MKWIIALLLSTVFLIAAPKGRTKDITLSWPATNAIIYKIYSSTNLINWQLLSTTSNVTKVSYPVQNVRSMFFQIKADLKIFYTNLNVTLAWDIGDNSPDEVAGYFLYSGYFTTNYYLKTNVGNVTAAKLYKLSNSTTYHFAASAYDYFNIEGLLCPEIIWVSPPPTVTISNVPMPLAITLK